MNGYQLFHANEPIERAGGFAVLLGEVDGGHCATTPVGDIVGDATDPTARVENRGLRGDLAQINR